MKTSTNYNVVSITGGSYYHFVIKYYILKEIISSGTLSVLDIGLVRMQLNIDGLPLFKSSGIPFLANIRYATRAITVWTFYNWSLFGGKEARKRT